MYIYDIIAEINEPTEGDEMNFYDAVNDILPRRGDSDVFRQRMEPIGRLVNDTYAREKLARENKDENARLYAENTTDVINAAKIAKAYYAGAPVVDQEDIAREVEAWERVYAYAVDAQKYAKEKGGVLLNNTHIRVAKYRMDPALYYEQLQHKAVRHICGLRTFGMAYYEIVQHFCERNKTITVPLRTFNAAPVSYLPVPIGDV